MKNSSISPTKNIMETVEGSVTRLLHALDIRDVEKVQNLLNIFSSTADSVTRVRVIHLIVTYCEYANIHFYLFM